jgi:hypothetical protein
MYIKFEVTWFAQIQQLNQQIEHWCDRYEARHAKKVIKKTLRLTFDDHKNYSLFALTWRGAEFEFMNIDVY